MEVEEEWKLSGPCACPSSSSASSQPNGSEARGREAWTSRARASRRTHSQPPERHVLLNQHLRPPHPPLLAATTLVTMSEAKATTANGNGNGVDASASAAAPKSYNVQIAKQPGAHGKPDKAHHDSEMDRLKKEIEKVQGEVNNVKALLSGAGPSANTPQGQRRQKLRAELDELRGQQAGAKGARGKVLDELKALQEATGKKVSAK